MTIISNLNNKPQNSAHILYCFEDLEQYLSNAAHYIISGIEKGDQIILIDNDKIYSKLREEISITLSTEQLMKVNFVNNFDYYCVNGQLHPPTTLDYFYKVVHPYYENDIPF
ncbi:DcmR-like sensory protein [Mesobacillus foraminis]|uniref:DcmR-like sensory protein n=1 Tax=Mesobacillus foraminis TaxID=279826 RepID=A0A4R2B3J0_9BACI|nr:DcmR-like sensory protein [Mesobacillus foraminis]